MESAHEGFVWTLSWHPLGHLLCSGANDHTWLVAMTTVAMVMVIIIHTASFGAGTDLGRN